MRAILTTALAGFFVVFFPNFASAETCMSEAEATAKFKPGEFFLAQRDEVISEDWQLIGIRLLLSNPKTGKFVEMNIGQRGYCVTEFVGDPRIRGEAL